MTDLEDMELIANLVPLGARVLDLGCGDGRMLEYLQTHRKCTGYGVEFSAPNVVKCIQRKVNVLQLNLENGLSLFKDQTFDIVLQLDALQHLRSTEAILMEATRVGRICIVSFPNFAHWPNRLSILLGRMPVTKRLPYQWYETPNIRVVSYSEVLGLAKKRGLKIVDSFGVHKGSTVRLLPNLLASVALFKLQGALG